MLLQMKGLRRQGDIWIQRAIIRNLSTDDKTKLCIVVEPYGRYGMQDDTAIDLSLDFKRVNLLDRLCKIEEWPRDVAEEIMMPIAEEIFQMEGLVAIECSLNKVLIDVLMKALEEYYFQHVKADTINRTHLVFVLPSEGNQVASLASSAD